MKRDVNINFSYKEWRKIEESFPVIEKILKKYDNKKEI